MFAALRGAQAQPTSSDRSLATQLFKEGRTLLEQGHVSQACRKLEDRQRLDPGGGTLLNVALCHEKEGRSATAWAEFNEGIGIAKKDERPLRVEFARTHIAQLEPVLSRLVIQVPPGADLPDLEIRRDGTVLGRAAWGIGMVVDPGDHWVEVTAPGKTSWKQSISVGARADLKTVVVPPLENAPSAPIAAAPAAPAAVLAASSAAPTPAPADPGHDIAISADSGAPARGSTGPSPVAWVSLGVGVAAAGVGTYFGIRAISLKSDADKACEGNVCTAEGADKNDKAITSSNISTVSFAVGIVGLGLGTYLLATTAGGSRPSNDKAHATAFQLATADVTVGRTGGGLTVSGRW